MANKMKGITCCGDCVQYDWNKHRCKRGFYKENDPLAPFFDNCGLPDVQPVVHGKWEHVSGYATPGGDPIWRCSRCQNGLHVYGVEHGAYGQDIADGQWMACPNCGADMRVP